MHVEGGMTNLTVQAAAVYYVTASLGLRVRKEPSRQALAVGALPYGTRVLLADGSTQAADGFTWAQVKGGAHHGDWLAMGKEDQSEMYVSRFPPAS